MNTVEQRKALKRFHALCGELKLSTEDKRALVEGAGADSSADLPAWKLHSICENLRLQANPKAADMDALRKRVMASIGGWLKAAGYNSDAERIKTIACRATGYERFNAIPVGRLHNLYHNFRNKQIDKIAAESLMRELVGHKIELPVSTADIPN